MEIKGKIIHVLPLQSGVGKASGKEWKKQEYVLETQETYPKKVCFNLFGDRIDQNPVQIGDDVTVSFDLESREFNGRWYTDVRAYRIEKGAGMPPVSTAPAAGIPGEFPPAPADLPVAGPNDDLPF
ncbi:MAG: DUF3127 domain-containing protein [Muribaculaceae bacterium]|nr:DUF3127 domain-containing protein [Muribaculaceae bacterium]MDE6166133.1 DUF3127 domain-containing protein [Muribaculaceae bacterium]